MLEHVQKTLRSNPMKCPVEYDDEKEPTEKHPDQLPTEGWSDPDDDEKVLSAAVQLLVLKAMTKRSATPFGHRRSVLEHVQKTLRAVRRARAIARAGARTAGHGAAHEQGAQAVQPCDRRVCWAPSVSGGSAVELKPILHRNKYGSGQWNAPKPVRSKR